MEEDKLRAEIEALKVSNSFMYEAAKAYEKMTKQVYEKLLEAEERLEQWEQFASYLAVHHLVPPGHYEPLDESLRVQIEDREEITYE